MGLFKDIKNTKKGLDDLGASRGGMPSMRGAFTDIKSLVDDKGEKEVLEKGIPVKAIVKGFPEPVPGDKFAMQIPLEIHPQNGEPYPINYVFPSARMQAAMSVGMELPVKVLPDDPQRIAVQWEAQKAAIAAAGGDMAAVTQGLQGAYGNAADDAMRKAKDDMKAQDPEEKLKKLAQMKEAGLINDEEFAAKKAEILADI